MKIGYVIYNDRPQSGIIKTQVISLLKEIKRQAPEIDITLIMYWQPWVAFKYRKDITNMRNELSKNDICLKSYPWAIVPCRYFLYKYYLFPLLYYWTYSLFKFTLSNHYDILHCRSYFESLMGAALKKQKGWKLIFDMRSLFPEENVTKGEFKYQDKSFNMWKGFERHIIKSADATIGVSQPMIDDVLRINPKSNAILIPCCVDTATFSLNKLARDKYRRINGWENKLVVLYEGSLSFSSWNNIKNYIRYFSFILGIRPDAHFLIITPSKDIDFPTIMNKYGIKNSQYTVKEAKGFELAGWLSASDIGLQVMSKLPDSHTRLGIKFVEYLSCGLPVIVNSNVGGAARIIKDKGVGAVIDLEEKDKEIKNISLLFSSLSQLRNQCITTANEMFSTKVCAQRYIQIYSSLD